MFLNSLEEGNQTNAQKTANLTIKNGIKKLDAADSMEEKASIAEKLLLETGMLKSENALCQFDDAKWYNEENLLKKFLEYKKIEGFYPGIDCDVSLLSVVLYVLLNKKMQLKDITLQPGSTRKYEIHTDGRRLKGDTLTSAQIILKKYLGCLWKRINDNEQLQSIKKYREFFCAFPLGVSTQGMLFLDKKKYKKEEWIYCYYEYSDIIWNVMEKEAKDFLASYFMFGNYMCIPGNSHHIRKGTTSFNMARSNFGKWDTVDTLLAKLFAYCKYERTDYLRSIFSMEKEKIVQEELTQETILWIESFDDTHGSGLALWKAFVEKNCLSAFVDSKTGIPISMKTGQPIDLGKIRRYDAIPKNAQEYREFFKRVSEAIVRRSEDLYNKLSK